METRPELKTQILEATLGCLAEKGTAAVGLREVAKAAGVALSQIHYYFGSKEGLLVAATGHMLHQQLQALQAELEGTDDATRRVSKAIRFVRSGFNHNQSWRKVYLDLLSMAAWSPTLAAETRRLQDELVDVIFSEAARVARPDFKSKAVARVVLGALDGLALQALQGAPEQEMDAAFAALEQFLAPFLR